MTSLYDKLVAEGSRGFEYSYMLDRLKKFEFTAVLPLDDNRIDSSIKYQWKEGFNDCLSLIYSVAEDLHNMMYSHKQTDDVDVYFWLLCGNLGLTEYSDTRIRTSIDTKTACDACIDEILEIFVGRRYDKFGVGSLFPVTNGPKDMRDTEIWYQMQYYFRENNLIERDNL